VIDDLDVVPMQHTSVGLKPASYIAIDPRLAELVFHAGGTGLEIAFSWIITPGHDSTG
jgi:hypothetical protein